MRAIRFMGEYGKYKGATSVPACLGKRKGASDFCWFGSWFDKLTTKETSVLPVRAELVEVRTGK